MFGIGIDICEVKRFDRLKDNEAFIKKVFTDNEINYCSNKKTCAQFFAVRFAAKEAFAKALGTGFRFGVNYREIEVNKDDLGKPYLKLFGNTEKKFNEIIGGTIHLSLSHEKNAAVAVVVIENLEKINN